MTELQDIIISRVRVKMLELFFQNTEEMYYVRQITREIKEEINAVRRELDRLLGAGMLKSEQRGNRLYYSLNPRYIFFQEIQQMVAKNSNIGYKLRKHRRKLGKVSYIMFSGKFIRGIKPMRDDVDILIIGDILLKELDALIKEEQKRIDREINYAVFSDEEFDFRKTRRDPFIMEILYNSRVMVIGSEDDFSHRESPTI